MDLLKNVSFDNVTLTAVPEPTTLGYAIAGLCVVAGIARRKALRNTTAAVAMLFAVNAQASLLPSNLPSSNLLPTDTLLNVTLLPDTQYTVSVDVTTNAVTGLLALLIGGDSPLQILDQNNNVLGEIPAQDLIDLLTGATGTVTTQLDTVIQTAGTSVVDPIARVLDDGLIQISNVTLTLVTTPPTSPAVTAGVKAADRSPTVRIKNRKLDGASLRLKGVAADDQRVSYVDVAVNGRHRHAVGTSKWTAKSKLRAGRNRVVVKAYDSANNASAPKKLTIRVN